MSTWLPGGGAVDPATGDALLVARQHVGKTGGYQMYCNSQGVWFATDGKMWNGKYHLGIRLAPVVPAGQTTPPAKTNFALGKSATQSSQYEFARADLAVDGFTMGNLHLGSVSHTWNDPQPWWQVDLGATTRIGVIKVFNRTDCCADRLHDWTVSVLDANNQVVWSSTQAAQAANVTSLEHRRGQRTLRQDPAEPLRLPAARRGPGVRQELGRTGSRHRSPSRAHGSARRASS